MSSYQLTDSENNALVLLSSVTTDSEDGNELNLQKIGHFLIQVLMLCLQKSPQKLSRIVFR